MPHGDQLVAGTDPYGLFYSNTIRDSASRAAGVALRQIWTPVNVMFAIDVVAIYYMTGAVAAGNVIGALFKSQRFAPAPAKLMDTGPAAQAPANTWNALAGSAPLRITPGQYIVGLLFELATATFWGGTAVGQSRIAVASSFQWSGTLTVTGSVDVAQGPVPHVLLGLA